LFSQAAAEIREWLFHFAAKRILNSSGIYPSACAKVRYICIEHLLKGAGTGGALSGNLRLELRFLAALKLGFRIPGASLKGDQLLQLLAGVG
jgi:hypothetical protein